MKTFQLFGCAGAAALLLLAGCTDNSTPPVATGNASVTAKASSGLQGAQLVLSQENQALDTVTVGAAGQDIRFAGLEPGEYTITIVMPDGREFNTAVTVGQGDSLYLGVIKKEDRGVSTGADTAYPGDPTYPYPVPESDFIAWHYPANGEVVTLYQYASAVYDSMMTNGSPPAGGSTGTDTNIMEPFHGTTALYISVQFSKVMNRLSVLESFSITPDPQGTASTDYWVDYWTPVEPLPPESLICLPYTICFDNTPTDSVAIGAEIREVPIAYTDCTWVAPEPSPYARSFTYSFMPNVQPGDTASYTVTFSGAAKDSAGNPVQAPYSFTFKVVVETLAVTPLPEPVPGCAGMACTMLYASYGVWVVDPAGLPVDTLQTSLVSLRTGDTLQVRQEGFWGAGFYTLLDDSYTWYLSTQPDTFQFSAWRGPDTVRAWYVFSTDTCRCHIGKVSGPDTLVLQ